MDSIKLDSILNSRKDIPDCCRECKNFDSEYSEGYLMGYWCNLNIYFPYKKQSCKKQVKWK